MPKIVDVYEAARVAVGYLFPEPLLRLYVQNKNIQHAQVVFVRNRTREVRKTQDVWGLFETQRVFDVLQEC